MAKGSVRKKGKKWYGRFYIEDESGRKVQKEFAGTESKAETEAMLRKAIADYEEKQFVGKAENITVGDMLDMWVEEELDLCQYFRQKKLKGYAAVLSSSSSFCCGVI